MSDWWNVAGESADAVRRQAETVVRETGVPQYLHTHAADVVCMGEGCSVMTQVRLGRGERLEDASGKRLAP